ncbi:uncharacterized protein MONOS_12098 [Monocercomonoides exilis]|uniref:uncharacterized protein n=1 Tax=Monocercomonoides exilis TaxID=2049356 RepID=UPI0035598A76|nr:hypothetical protein MONOS_12098 [Monocercomonoides exilis]|eukprot:MONOS_12098.1-p1 / transcript=MONOS_12098.1 / gene=MONOS_12098 / organism=Monocercomonoides_exilis_PA203 / gene_product=unspecified product / transcript_product=unspecified product / location=Mono_scaffold00645:24172-25638(-) / protein_length=489 / sequence_SO=supercontig / SO=protein_coding / is_pseudo=false
MGKDVEAGAFDVSGSIGVLTNVTLKGWRRGGEIYSGRLFGGKGYGREKGGGEEKGGEGGEIGRGRGREGDGEGEDIEGSISVSESRFSSFCVSSAPFLSSPSIPLMSLSKLTFFNISIANEACSPPTTTSAQATCLMNSCSFSSVCDVYDGGIVPSLNNPFASLIASNTSFVGCCRTRNVVCEGTSDRKLTPGRQNETENGTNSFIWCEWNGSKTTGNKDDYTDDASNGGAIRMYNLNSGELSVSHCSFNDCTAFYHGGAIMCHAIKTIKIVSNVFNSCTAHNFGGGGVYAYQISSCALVSGCDFQMCKAHHDGGGLRLFNFSVPGSGCIGEEDGEGGSSCVFECNFTSCSTISTWGGGLYCNTVPAAFKVRSIQLISCSATANGGGLYFESRNTAVPTNYFYCYFLFFHECKCSANTPYGHDAIYYDQFNVFLSSGNPFNECYTTNTDNQRVCYVYYYSSSGSWVFGQTTKMDWLKDKLVCISACGS